MLFAVCWLAISCSPLRPGPRLSQYSLKVTLQENADGYALAGTNPVACPLRLSMRSSIQEVDSVLRLHQPLTLAAHQSFEIPLGRPAVDPTTLAASITRSSQLGAPDSLFLDTTTVYGFPFLPARSYSVLQASNSTFTHNKPYNRFAVDFKMPVGDTVCAARAGIVVGVIQDYKKGGKKPAFRGRDNFISLYHPDGVITQYVHLKHRGALVKLGDRVAAGQPIALSGNTGYSTTPHLHFNALIPVPDGHVSIPVAFPGIHGRDIRKGMRLGH